MGVDLALLPFESNFYSHSVLECERRRDLFAEIAKLPTINTPDRFSTYLCRDEKYEEPHYGNTITTPYGEHLTSTTAGALMMLADREDVKDNVQNRAIWAYLGMLNPKTRIALYWQ